MIRKIQNFVSSPFINSIPIQYFNILKNAGLQANFATSKSSYKHSAYDELARDFLDTGEFYKKLLAKNIKFFTGVPDSLLKDFCGYISDHHDKSQHIIAANEGLALSIAAGYHLATGQYPLVYMQNSGIGNITNPIMSLAHAKIYSIPMLLMVGWRGFCFLFFIEIREPGKKDEPQHMIQGKSTQGLLTEIGIKFEVLPDYTEGAAESLEAATFHMKNTKSPYAFIVRRQTFYPYQYKDMVKGGNFLPREVAVEKIVEAMGKYDIVVASTGFLARELYEVRDKKKQTHDNDFLCVGSMGHASSIAFGIAMQKPSRKIICMDGDGAALMHLGSFATIGSYGKAYDTASQQIIQKNQLNNYLHIVFNNGAHDSVGAQPTLGLQVNFCQIAKACGYKEAVSVSTEKEIEEAVTRILKSKEGPNLIEIKISTGARKDLGRPKMKPVANKKKFMESLRK